MAIQQCFLSTKCFMPALSLLCYEQHALRRKHFVKVLHCYNCKDLLNGSYITKNELKCDVGKSQNF